MTLVAYIDRKFALAFFTWTNRTFLIMVKFKTVVEDFSTSDWIIIGYAFVGSTISLVSLLTTVKFGIKLYQHQSNFLVRLCSFISAISFSIGSSLYVFFAVALVLTDYATWTENYIVILPRFFYAIGAFLILVIAYQRLQLTLKTTEYPLSSKTKLIIKTLIIITFIAGCVMTFGTRFYPRIIPFILGPTMVCPVTIVIIILSLFIHRLVKVK